MTMKKLLLSLCTVSLLIVANAKFGDKIIKGDKNQKNDEIVITTSKSASYDEPALELSVSPAATAPKNSVQSNPINHNLGPKYQEPEFKHQNQNEQHHNQPQHQHQQQNQNHHQGQNQNHHQGQNQNHHQGNSNPQGWSRSQNFAYSYSNGHENGKPLPSNHKQIQPRIDHAEAHPHPSPKQQNFNNGGNFPNNFFHGFFQPKASSSGGQYNQQQYHGPPQPPQPPQIPKLHHFNPPQHFQGPPFHGPGPNHGPQNFGPQNHGPQNHGPQNHGPQNHGHQNHGHQNHGPHRELHRHEAHIPHKPPIIPPPKHDFYKQNVIPLSHEQDFAFNIPQGFPNPKNDPRAQLKKELMGAENNNGKPWGHKVSYTYRDPKNNNNYMEVSEVHMSMNKQMDPNDASSEIQKFLSQAQNGNYGPFRRPGHGHRHGPGHGHGSRDHESYADAPEYPEPPEPVEPKFPDF